MTVVKRFENGLKSHKEEKNSNKWRKNKKKQKFEKPDLRTNIEAIEDLQTDWIQNAFGCFKETVSGDA